jgi:penicillin-binding protein 1C
LSGDVCGHQCPHTVSGWFIPGKSPIKTCSIHQLVCVDPATHQRIPECRATPSTIRSVMEVWTPEQRQLLARAGRCPPEPPAWDTGNTPSNEAPPRIISPTRSLIIANEEGVPLRARASQSRDLLQWFAGNTYLGCTPNGETLLWKPSRGTYQLTVTSGLVSACREITIR